MNAMTYKDFRNTPATARQAPPATSAGTREVLLELGRAYEMSTDQLLKAMVERTSQTRRYAPRWLSKAWANFRWNPLTVNHSIGNLKKLGLVETRQINGTELFHLTATGLHASL